MNDPNWLTLRVVEYIHDTSIQKTGGSHDIRDAGLLESALARPKNLHAYGESDIFQLAASYAESIARNHPFVDGNKRTGFASAGMFLRYNGYDLRPGTGNNHADMIENLAQGKITKEEAGQYFKDHADPVS